MEVRTGFFNHPWFSEVQTDRQASHAGVPKNEGPAQAKRP